MSRCEIGHAVRYVRFRHKWTQAALAEEMGVSKGCISMVENHKRDPSWSFVCRLAEVSGVALVDLILEADQLSKSHE